jgi:PhoH-like ATPase
MRKTFVLDTSVLLYDKEAIHGFQGNDIVMPLPVLEELDKFKDRSGVIGDHARYVNRFLDNLRSLDKEDGWYVLDDIRYRFELSSEIHDAIPEGFDIGYNDNILLGCTMFLQKTCEQVVLITKDINLRVKADAVGVAVEDYKRDRVEKEVADLKGWTEVNVEVPELNLFHQEKKLEHLGDEELRENMFCILKSWEGSGLGIFKNGWIHKLWNEEINGPIHLRPRNSEQRFALEALMDPNIPLVTLTGLAGSGKTFLTLMAALSQMKHPGRASGVHALSEDFEKAGLEISGYDRLVISRTLQHVGNRDLGYLPGTLEEKMAPWLMPILDNVRVAFNDTSYFERMVEKGEIEIAPIPYIRGRTFQNCILIVDEAQNATIHELKTIITRMGTGSKLVLLGDVDQIDTPYIDKQSSGLSIVIDKFQNSELAAHVNLSKGQRSSLASVASNIL